MPLEASSGSSPDGTTPATATGGDPVSDAATSVSAEGSDASGSTGAEATGSDATAQSSSAEDKGAKDAPRPSLLDVVKDALKPAAEREAPPGPKTQTDPKSEAEGAKPALSAEDEAKLPFHKHPRWQEIKARNRELDGANKTLTAQAAEYKRDAETFRVIETFRTKSNIALEEMTAGLKTMALIKNDPGRALPELRRIVASLELAVGDRLPEDLQAKVDSGSMDEPSAKELARARAANSNLTTHVETARARDSEREVGEARDAIAGEVSKWEVAVAKSDPDWKLKQPMVTERSIAIVHETGQRPRNPAEALALAKRAYEDVNQRFTGLRPQPRKTDRGAPSGMSATGVTPKPTSIYDAARSALAAA